MLFKVGLFLAWQGHADATCQILRTAKTLDLIFSVYCLPGRDSAPCRRSLARRLTENPPSERTGSWLPRGTKMRPAVPEGQHDRPLA